MKRGFGTHRLCFPEQLHEGIVQSRSRLLCLPRNWGVLLRDSNPLPEGVHSCSERLQKAGSPGLGWLLCFPHRLGVLLPGFGSLPRRVLHHGGQLLCLKQGLGYLLLQLCCFVPIGCCIHLLQVSRHFFGLDRLLCLLKYCWRLAYRGDRRLGLHCYVDGRFEGSDLGQLMDPSCRGKVLMLFARLRGIRTAL